MIEFPFQELADFTGPVYIFQHNNRYFYFSKLLFFQPDIPKAFSQKPKDTGFIAAVIFQVDRRFQQEKDIKQPGAIRSLSMTNIFQR
jgi:hypothetical protein